MFNPQVFFSFLSLLSLFGLAVYLIYRYRDQAPATRLIAFGILFFFLALAVESSFMPMVDVINEHRLYLPSVGAFAAFTVSAFLLANYWQQERPRMAKLVFPVLLLMVLLFTGSTYKRNLVWQSDITLWQDVLEKSPNKARPYNEMGVALGRSGKYDKVIPYYQRAIKLNPHDNFPYVNLGVAYGELGRQAEGVAMLLKAIEIREDTNAYNNLGLAYLKQKKIKEAEAMYRKALEIHPGNATARGNLKLLKKRQQALQASESAPQATSRKLRPGQSSPGQTKAPPTHPAKKKKPPTPRRKTAN